jgi:C4-type Zn-finger protein
MKKPLSKCPKCDSEDIEKHCIEDDWNGEIVNELVYCRKCEYTWNERFKFLGNFYVFIDLEIETPEEENDEISST